MKAQLHIIFCLIIIMSPITALSSSNYKSSKMIGNIEDENSDVRVPLKILDEATKIPYAEAAESLARWIYHNMSIPGPSDGRVFYDRTGATYYYNGMIGSAGIGEYFIELYKYTQNGIYLSWAQEVAIHLNQTAIRDGSNIYWQKSNIDSSTPLDYQYGSAGIGDFLIQLDNITDGAEAFYLELVTGAANGIIAQASENNSMIFWNQDENVTGGINCTGFYTGAAGMGYFLLQAGQATSTQEYLDAAQSTANWLINVTETVNLAFNNTGDSVIDQRFWPEKFLSIEFPSPPFNETKQLRSMRASRDAENQKYYTGFAYGAAGIGHFFLEAGNFFNNNTFFEYAKYAGNWLLSLAHPWAEYEGADTDYQYVGNHLGASGIGKFLLSLYTNDNTRNDLYLAAAAYTIDWYSYTLFNETDKNLGVHWPNRQLDGANYTGLDATAGVIGFLTDYVSIIQENETLISNPLWLGEQAKDLAQYAIFWILTTAEYDGTTMQIPREKGGLLEGQYYTGAYYGAAGIGAVLLMRSGPEASTNSMLDFNSVQKDTSKSLNLTVTNLGDESLSLTTASVSSSVFSVELDQFPITLENGDNETIEVTFTPLWEEEYEAFLNISTSDSTNPNLLVALKGVGWTAPVIEVLEYDQKVTTGNFTARFNITDGTLSPLFQVSYNIDGRLSRIITSTTSEYKIVLDTLELELANHETYNLTLTAIDTNNHQSSVSILFETDIDEKRDEEGIDLTILLLISLVGVSGGLLLLIAYKTGFLLKKKEKAWWEGKEEDWFKKKGE